MFDLRYHVASLAAVFLALIVGILVGVGIASQDVVAKSERDLLRKDKAALEQRLDRAEGRIVALTRSQSTGRDFIDGTYRALMANRLRGRQVALVFVGSVDAKLRAAVQEALRDGGGPGLFRLRALKVPVDVRAIRKQLASRPALVRYAGERNLAELGTSLAVEFVLGGATPLWNALETTLVEERSGNEALAADAVVVVRTAGPQQRATARFLRGFYTGLASPGFPVVGVEDSSEEVSAVETYRRRGISSVDDVDTAPGRLALAVLLAGGRPGRYGVKPTADALLPPVEPVAPPSG
ncbi:MAG: copper transporter [Gaiellaceae bacterium]